jgi:hypothetical protein
VYKLGVMRYDESINIKGVIMQTKLTLNIIAVVACLGAFLGVAHAVAGMANSFEQKLTTRVVVTK